MPKKILLADDSITIQKVVELTFSDGDYEVTAVNNGARAIQKLSEFRPDIILSDIIMPEKNGYEVCEFVKSHPEHRTIPVVLLTGTFEPFDPDRADKAGCDAVVTKPFESQSLIHKVEELIEQSRAASPASTPQTAAPPPPAAPEPESPSPWAEEPAPAASEKRSPADIFGATAPIPGPTAEMPLSSPLPPAGGSTQAFPPVGFRAPDAPATTQQVTPPAASEEPAPRWDEPAPSAGETRALPKMSFEEMQRMASERSEEERDQQQTDDSPFGAPPPAEEFSGETRAFPKMNFADLDKGAPSQPAPEEPAPTAGETRAFPKMSIEQLSGDAGEMPAASESEPGWPEPPQPQDAAWSLPAAPEPDEETAPKGFDATSEPAAPEPEEPAWSAEPAAAASGNGVELTDDQVDRIARRVIQLMSDQVVRSIAWEVIPDMAEMVVKERIRQLENEG